MMLIGLIWAAFAPLVLFGLFALILFLTRNTRLEKRYRIGLAAIVILLPVLLVWAPQRIEFARVCAANGTPMILKTVSADGFFLDDSTANSFGTRYLYEDGFRWFEAKSIYNREKFTRYEINTGKISQSEVEKLTAKYIVTSTWQQLEGYSDTEITIADRESGERLASAHSMLFDGGVAKWVLGAWGVASCPSGSEDFQKMYHLAKLTLRPGPEK